MKLYSQAFIDSFKPHDETEIDHPPEELENGDLNLDYIERANNVFINDTFTNEIKFRILENSLLLKSPDDKTRNCAIGALNELEILLARFEFLHSKLVEAQRQKKMQEEAEDKEAAGLKQYEPNII